MEPIDGRSHSLQAAALAIESGADDALVVAALLHDIARHPVVAEQFPHLEHAEAAARWLEPLFGSRIAWLVEQHVPAKRFLVATDETYRSLLSADSICTLADQGEVLSADEVERFASHPWADDALRLRRWDDMAKVIGAAVPPRSHLEPLVQRLLIPARA